MEVKLSKIEGPLPVVAGVISNPAGKLLIAKRASTSRFGAGLWEFPGGKVDPGEDPPDTLKREIEEELAIAISVQKLLGLISHVYHDPGSRLHILLMVYAAKWAAGEVKNLEVADSCWIEKTELASYQFATADQMIIDQFIKL